MVSLASSPAMPSLSMTSCTPPSDPLAAAAPRVRAPFGSWTLAAPPPNAVASPPSARAQSPTPAAPKALARLPYAGVVCRQRGCRCRLARQGSRPRAVRGDRPYVGDRATAKTESYAVDEGLRVVDVSGGRGGGGSFIPGDRGRSVGHEGHARPRHAVEGRGASHAGGWQPPNAPRTATARLIPWPSGQGALKV